MIIHNIKSVPKRLIFPNTELDEFDEFDMENLEKLKLDEIWYWYLIGSYDGSGQILMREGNLYDLHNAGHCSCYGPTSRIEFHGRESAELLKSVSKEYYDGVEDLFKAAGLL